MGSRVDLDALLCTALAGWASNHAGDDQKLALEIAAIQKASGETYGSPRPHAELLAVRGEPQRVACIHQRAEAPEPGRSEAMTDSKSTRCRVALGALGLLAVGCARRRCEALPLGCCPSCCPLCCPSSTL
jgi:hypothetical protein